MDDRIHLLIKWDRNSAGFPKWWQENYHLVAKIYPHLKDIYSVAYISISPEEDYKRIIDLYI